MPPGWQIAPYALVLTGLATFRVGWQSGNDPRLAFKLTLYPTIPTNVSNLNNAKRPSLTARQPKKHPASGGESGQVKRLTTGEIRIQS